MAIVNSLANGSKRPTLKANRGLRVRVVAVLCKRNGDAVCSWTKGHATIEMVERGQVSKKDKIGSDEADYLAVGGRIAHGGDPQFAADTSFRQRPSRPSSFEASSEKRSNSRLKVGPLRADAKMSLLPSQITRRLTPFSHQGKRRAGKRRGEQWTD